MRSAQDRGLDHAASGMCYHRPVIDERTGMLVAMLIGVAGTTTIHLSKGVMRLGIKLIAIARSNGAGTGRASAIYALGVALNFTNPLWVILANRFAPTVFYTSMYGMGLVALLVFARVALAERLHRVQLIGVAIVLLGTLLVGVGNLTGDLATLYAADRTLLIVVTLGWSLATLLGALLLRRRPLGLQETFFGVAAGGLAGLEAIMKGVAQAGAVQNTLLPTDTAGWWLFGASFLGAVGAFGMIQWSYVRACRASVMGSVYNVAYVALPLVLTVLVVADARLGVWSITGLFVLTVGVIAVGGG